MTNPMDVALTQLLIRFMIFRDREEFVLGSYATEELDDLHDYIVKRVEVADDTGNEVVSKALENLHFLVCRHLNVRRGHKLKPSSLNAYLAYLN